MAKRDTMQAINEAISSTDSEDMEIDMEESEGEEMDMEAMIESLQGISEKIGSVIAALESHAGMMSNSMASGEEE